MLAVVSLNPALQHQSWWGCWGGWPPPAEIQRLSDSLAHSDTRFPVMWVFFWEPPFISLKSSSKSSCLRPAHTHSRGSQATRKISPGWEVVHNTVHSPKSPIIHCLPLWWGPLFQPKHLLIISSTYAVLLTASLWFFHFSEIFFFISYFLDFF